MQKKLAELAELVGGELYGDGTLLIDGAMPFEWAGPGTITFLAPDRKPSEAPYCRASALIIVRDFPRPEMPTIIVGDPKAALLRIAREFLPTLNPPMAGLHPTAIVDPTARLGNNVSVGPFAVIEAHVEVGDNSVIHPHAVIRQYCKLGAAVEIHPHATLYPFTEVGDRSIIHSGVVLGCDGFGYEPGYPTHTKVPQLGKVEIAADVEIGANSTVDRSTLGSTLVGESTKIDNQVQIGHNCRIGPRNFLAAHVGLAGSCTTGDFVWMAGKVGVADHIHVGNGAMLMAFTGVHKDIPAGDRQVGIPSRPLLEFAKQQSALTKLPELLKSQRAARKRESGSEQSPKREVA